MDGKNQPGETPPAASVCAPESLTVLRKRSDFLKAARARRQGKCDTRRTQKDDIFVTQQDNMLIRPRDKRMQSRERVIDLAPGKANGDHQRSRDIAQGLIEIGTVLLSDIVKSIWWNLRPRPS